MSNFFDLDEILASQQTVLCKFEVPVPKLGFFDKNNRDPDLKAGTKLQLPCWLAKGLLSRQRALVAIELPKTYRMAYRQILEADAHIVDLQRFGSYFYDFGLQLISFNTTEMEQIRHTLIKTFIARFRTLMDKSNNSLCDATTPMHLDKREKQIYDVAQKATSDFVMWQYRHIEKINASSTVTNQLKRKYSER